MDSTEQDKKTLDILQRSENLCASLLLGSLLSGESNAVLMAAHSQALSKVLAAGMAAHIEADPVNGQKAADGLLDTTLGYLREAATARASAMLRAAGGTVH